MSCEDAGGKGSGRGGAVRASLTRMAALVAALGFALAAPVPSSAQELTAYGVGYLDGDATQFGLVGVMVRPGGLGWQPVGTLEGFVLSHDVQEGRGTFFGVAPGAGLLFAAPNWLGSVRASYHFVTGDVPGDPLFVGGESGPALTGQAVSWAGPTLEGLAHYNLPARFLWTEGRALFPVARLDPGSIDVGGELIWQTGVGEGQADGALMAGPAVRWSGPSLLVTLGGGVKMNTGDADDSWYTRFSVVLP